MITATRYVKLYLGKRRCHFPVRVSVDFTTHPFEQQFIVLLSQFVLAMDLNWCSISKAEMDSHHERFFDTLKDRVYAICAVCESGMNYTTPKVFEGLKTPVIENVTDTKSLINALVYLTYELFGICQLINEDLAAHAAKAKLIPVFDEMTHYAGEMMYLAELRESKICY